MQRQCCGRVMCLAFSVEMPTSAHSSAQTVQSCVTPCGEPMCYWISIFKCFDGVSLHKTRQIMPATCDNHNIQVVFDLLTSGDTVNLCRLVYGKKS